MIDSLCVIGWIVGYMMIAGVVMHLLLRRWPTDKYTDPFGQVMGGIFWPIAGPTVLAYLLAKHATDSLDRRRAVAKAEADELRKHVAELDEELRASKSPAAT